MTIVKAYWHDNNTNFGDMLTPVIIKSISGSTPESAKFREKDKFLVCGSIIEATADGDQTWGSGALFPKQILGHKANYTCCMARRYLSRDFIEPILWFEVDNQVDAINDSLDKWAESTPPDYETLLSLCPFNTRNITSTDELIRI